MKWAVIEDGIITNIYEGPEPPEGSYAIPDELNPFKIKWNGSEIVINEDGISLDALAGINRDTRNRLLTDCDWTQLPDVPLATREAWATYRQALRDLTDHVNWPNLSEADWPSPPED